MPATLERREFLTAGLAVGGALALQGVLTSRVGAQPPTAAFTRYSVFDPHAGLDSYVKGVAKMKEWAAADVNDPRGWTFQAAIHGSAMEGPSFNQCEHASWWFFSWHRAYLWFFERMIRQASGDTQFALPYWDWDSDGRKSLPPAFRDSNSTLFDNTRNDSVNNGDPLPALDIDPRGALSTASFLGPTFNPGFGGTPLPRGAKGRLENPPHDAVHVLISGNMGDPSTAALDPIFWLHHANIDRLWDVWLASGRVNPSQDAWKNNTDNGQVLPFPFYDENSNQVTVLTADFIPGSARLDYQYDNLNGNPAVMLTSKKLRTQVVAEGETGEKLKGQEIDKAKQEAMDTKRKKLFGEASRVKLTASEDKITLGGEPVVVEAKIAEENRPRLKLALELAKEDVARPPAVVLHIEGVESKGPPGVVYRVFLNKPKDAVGNDPDETNFVGTIALFRAKGHGHKEKMGEDFTFDITRLVQNLKERGKWNDEKLDVTFISKGVGGRNQPKNEVTCKRVAVTIERN